VKRSERLIRNTLLVLAGGVVLHVGVSRIYAVDDPTAGMERTPPAVLATLRDFAAIEVEGDFALDVERAADFAVDFSSPTPTEGRFYATVRNNTLLLGGFRNAPGSRVHVVLPELKKLNAGSVQSLSLSGFDGASLSLETDTVPRVTLRNNTIRQWQIRANHVADLQIDRASLSAGKVDLAGRATLTVID
jgi:hypothetical protein